MSLPITAVGPLKVEMNPILMLSPAKAGLASASAAAPASKNAVLMVLPLLVASGPAVGTRYLSDLFFARNRRPAASQNAGICLEPLAQTPTVLHHNSRESGVARIIMPVWFEFASPLNDRSPPLYGGGS